MPNNIAHFAIHADDCKRAKAVTEHGGSITMEPMVIQTVGTLVMFEDTEGNRVGAMQYFD